MCVSYIMCFFGQCKNSHQPCKIHPMHSVKCLKSLSEKSVYDIHFYLSKLIHYDIHCDISEVYIDR